MDRRPQLLGLILRYGLPLVVAIFYITAAQSISYTPPNAYASVLDAKELASGLAPGLPDHAISAPLWTLFIALGRALALDPVMTAKILSLVFSCFGLLAVYLLAVELTSDRILALLVTLAAALNPWLLQTGPSGTPVAIEIALTLAALFFVERGDLALGVLMAGLATLIAWQAVGVLAFVAAAVWWRSGGTSHSVQKVLGLLLIYVAVIAPWCVFAAIHGLTIIPSLPPSGEMLRALPVFLLLGVAAGAGALLGIRAVPGAPGRGLPGPGYRIVLWSWTGWMIVSGLLWGGSFWIVAAPVCVLLGYEGLFHFLAVRVGDQRIYLVVTAVTAGIILVQQLAFVSVIKPAMEESIRREEGTLMAVSWLKSRLSDSTRVQAEDPYRVSYFLDRPVAIWPPGDSLSADVVVAARDTLSGYEEVYRPAASAVPPAKVIGGVAVFHRR
jgi:hypothetical protein